MDSDPLPLLLGNQVCDAAVRQPGRLEYRVAVLEGSCRVEVEVVTPRSRRESVHWILSTLTSLMPSRRRARLAEDTILSASFRLSLGSF